MDFTTQEKTDLLSGQTNILIHLQRLDDNVIEIKNALYGGQNNKGLIRLCDEHEKFIIKYESILNENEQSVKYKHFWIMAAISCASLIISLSPVIKSLVFTQEFESVNVTCPK